MWSIYTVMGYFALALLIPIAWAMAKVWRKARAFRRVSCPRDGEPSLVELDPFYAMRMHALGNPELLVRQCTRWPDRARCGQECREQIGSRL